MDGSPLPAGSLRWMSIMLSIITDALRACCWNLALCNYACMVICLPGVHLSTVQAFQNSCPVESVHVLCNACERSQKQAHGTAARSGCMELETASPKTCPSKLAGHLRTNGMPHGLKEWSSICLGDLGPRIVGRRGPKLLAKGSGGRSEGSGFLAIPYIVCDIARAAV